MKSTIKSKDSQIVFPCLMKHPVAGAFILATGTGNNGWNYAGTLVHCGDGSSYKLGTVRTDWCDFEITNEEIILSN